MFCRKKIDQKQFCILQTNEHEQLLREGNTRYIAEMRAELENRKVSCTADAVHTGARRP